VSEAEPQDQLMVWGESGTGKTACLVRGSADMDLSFADVAYGRAKPVGDPTVFLLTVERNALSTAKQINPLCGYELCESIATTKEVLMAAVAGELRQAGYTRLAVDGLTEIQAQIGSQIGAKEADGYYTRLIDATWNMLRMLRSVPMQIACTALEQSKDGKFQPMFESRNIPGRAMSTQSAVGRATKIGDGMAQQFVVDFNLPAAYAVKDVGVLRGRVKPCAAAWLEVLAGTRDPETIRIVAADGTDPVVQPAAEAGKPVVQKIAR
jgi:hypothetical protein